MQITLYHLANSRSQRIVWLFEELSINYELIHYSKMLSQQHSQLPESALPLKFPTTIIKTSEQNIVLNESSAITEFFAEYSSQLMVKSNEIKIQSDYIFWKHYADASFMPNLALKQIFGQIVERTPLPFRWVSFLFKSAFNQGYLNQAIHEQLHRINHHLNQQTWLAGDVFSIADILLWFPLQACASAHPKIQQFPAVMHYIAQIQNRPAFQLALTKGQWQNSVFENYWQKAW